MDLRQILAIVRGIGVMLGLFWLLSPAVRQAWSRVGLAASGADGTRDELRRTLATRRDANGPGIGIMVRWAADYFYCRNPRAEIAQEPWLSFEFQVSSFVWRPLFGNDSVAPYTSEASFLAFCQTIKSDMTWPTVRAFRHPTLGT